MLDPDRLERIFRALTRMGAVGRLVEHGVTMGHIVAVPKPGPLGSSVRWGYDGPPWTGNLMVEIAGPLGLYRFGLEFGDTVDGRVDTPVPRALDVVRYRREMRMNAPEQVALRFRTRDGRQVVRDVHDVSRSGLAFVVSARDAVKSGAEIVGATIDWQTGMRVCARLIVRHVSEQFGEGRGIAGATVVFDSKEDICHWENEIEKLIDSTVHTGGTWTRDLWELFEKSGYFSLSNKRPDDFLHLRQAFEDTSRKIARASDVGVQVVWPSGRGVEASASIVALTDRSAIVYHVARRHGNPPAGVSGRTILYSIYQRTIRWIQSHEFVRWLVVWVQDQGRFPRRLHVDFALRHADHDQASIVKFHALEIPTHRPNQSERRKVAAKHSSPVVASDWTVRVAGVAERGHVAAILVAQFPPSFLAAHALPETRSDTWGESSLRHGREVVVAEREGRVEAAAIIDFCEEGVHLFGLLDVVRVVSMGPDAAQATDALLAHARAWFGQLGKSAFVLACPDIPKERWPEDAIDLGLTHCTVMSTQLLPQFAEHVWELTVGAAD